MTYFEVLVEGGSDVPALREVLVRKFGLTEGQDFRIHPHKGRGDLPANPLARPERAQQTLLHQLPAKLRGFSYLGDDACVVVVVDVDDTPCKKLLADLKSMLRRLPRKPQRVLFRLAIEETESAADQAELFTKNDDQGGRIEVEETRHPESDAAFLKRVLGSRKGRSQSAFVMNDEAHHAYHPITSPPELGVLLTKALAIAH